MKTLFWTVMLLVVAAADASTVTVIYNGIRVTGIGDLDIGGTLYNVDFNAPSGFPTFGGETDFWVVQFEAEVATVTVNHILTDLLHQPVDNALTDVYHVLWGGGQMNESELRGPGDWRITFIGPDDPSVGLRTAWSVAAVPVPAAVWLFGSALGLLGWMRRKAD